MQRICHDQRPSYASEGFFVDQEEQDMISISNRISIGSAAFVTAMLLAAGNAGAADRTATSADIAVKFSEVQLNSEADAENLYKKLRSAARAVCDDNAGGHRTLEVRTRAEKCVNQVLADAVRRIDKPMLTALHENKTARTSKEG
jgi:UrcA family protein